MITTIPPKVFATHLPDERLDLFRQVSPDIPIMMRVGPTTQMFEIEVYSIDEEKHIVYWAPKDTEMFPLLETLWDSVRAKDIPELKEKEKN